MRRLISRRSASNCVSPGTADADAATRAPGAATGLTGEMGPGARQPGQTVFVLRQFDLDRAFARAGVARKDVQDQRGTVEHLDLIAEGFFQLALLARGKLVVEDDQVCAPCSRTSISSSSELAGTDERGRVAQRLSRCVSVPTTPAPAVRASKRQFGERVI